MSLCQKLTCEGFGTFGLTFTVVMVNATAPPMTVFAVGIYLAVFAYAFGSVSGTHINPAVSLGVFTWGFIQKTASAVEFVCYIIIQYVGALVGGAVGALFLWALNGNGRTPPLVAPGLAPFGTFDNGIAFGGEFFACFFFILVILRVACSEKNNGNPVAGLAIGLALTLGLLICGGFSGGAMNPAVAAGACIANIVLSNPANGSILTHFVAYYAGPFVGALLAVGIHAALEKDCGEEEEAEPEPAAV